MGKIIILDENTSNMIAAGEVVERPASVVKELVENSIDSGATVITVEIKKGGIAYIRVTDNGNGIDEDDIKIAFERHATSKIIKAEDLETIKTMGFRGEALSSIASVSKIELTSRPQNMENGSKFVIHGGIAKSFNVAGFTFGTTMVVEELFFNTPARYKFLKKDSTEASYVSDMISKIAIGHPDVAFKFINNGKTIIRTPGNGDLKSTLFSIYGTETAKALIESSNTINGIIVNGYIGKPDIARANRNNQLLYVNSRYVKSKVAFSAIEAAYKTYLMKNKHGFVVLNVEMEPCLFDINVHPAKTEVKFRHEQDVFSAIYGAILNSLKSIDLSRNYVFDNQKAGFFNRESDVSLENPEKIKIEKSIDENRKQFAMNDLHENKNDTVKNTMLKETVDKNDEKSKQSGVIGIGRKHEYSKVALTDEYRINEPDVSEYIQNNLQEEISMSVAVESETVNQESTQEKNTLNLKQSDINGEKMSFEKEMFSKGKVLEQLFKSYILLEFNNELYIVDQHAAHERILYETLLEKYKNEELLSQMLLTPIVLETSSSELVCINDNMKTFEKVGFIIEEFGSNSVIIRSVPVIVKNVVAEDVFREILDRLSKNDTVNENTGIGEDLFHDIACKAAIKANKKLEREEIYHLISELRELDNSFTCPHGRPIIVKITQRELEKMFKRIL